MSLDTGGQLVVGSKTTPLASESAGLGGLVMGGFGSGGPSGATSTSPVERNSNPSNWHGNATRNGVEVIRGEAAELKSGLELTMGGVLVIAVVVFERM